VAEVEHLTRLLPQAVPYLSPASRAQLFNWWLDPGALAPQAYGNSDQFIFPVVPNCGFGFGVLPSSLISVNLVFSGRILRVSP